MTRTAETDVLIVGAGPVGTTMAIDLAQRGVRVVVIEAKPADAPRAVKCNHIAARTMEMYRRLGLAAALRDAGLPADFPNDVVFRTTMTGTELTRIPIPCRAERYTSREGPDTWWPTAEPPHRINQRYFEPILIDHARQQDAISLHFDTRFERHEAVDDGQAVHVHAVHALTGESLQFRCRFLVGCDGGSSPVRKQIGAKLEGTPVIQQVQSTWIRAPGLAARIPGKRAWSTYAVNPRRCGTVFAIDGHETWLVHNHLNPSEPDFDSVDRDWAIRQILGVEDDFPYEIISKEDWVGRRLVADRFRDGHVFIAGDAAHLWVPYAGYGMNAGLADGANLAWLLAARVQGWAGEAMLDAYEAERQPITAQVSHFAMEHAQKMIKARSAVPPQLEEDSDVGRAERQRIGDEAYRLNVNQFCCAGLNFGYYYEGSPIIVGDGAQPPEYSMGSYTASTVPGCRVPHVWLNDGRSLYDAFGPAYTLLRLHPQADVGPLVQAAAEQHLPLVVLDLHERVADALPAAYQHRLLLCRADQHVAWRGDELPRDCRQLVGVLRGAHHQGAKDLP